MTKRLKHRQRPGRFGRTQRRRSRKSQRLGIVTALLAAGFFAGCQSSPVPSGGFGGFRQKAEERRVEREAENDPFPSPKDVGLD